MLRRLAVPGFAIWLLLLLLPVDAFAAAYFSSSSGAWNTNNRWRTGVGAACGLAGNSGAAFPGSAAGDTATICNNTAITLPNTPANTLTSLTIGSTCANASSLASSTGNVALNATTLTLACANSTLTFNGVSGIFTLTAGTVSNAGTINVSANARVHVFNVGTDITGNGTINLRTAAGQVANLTLTGGGTHNITGTGALTFNNTTVNNTLVVNKTGGSIDQTGILAVTTDLTITAGTLNLSGVAVQTSTVGGAISNGGTLSFTGTAAQTLTVTGAITNTGTVSIGNQTVTHALNVGGNITNNTTGAIDLRLDIDSLCTLTFTGGGVHTIGGNTTGITDFYNVAPTTPTTDDITVNMTSTGFVALNGSLSARDLTVTAGTVTFNGALAAQTVTVNRNIINAGTINVSANARVHTLNVTGDITGNGTINLFTAAGQVANMTLTGGGTHNITGTGTLTFNNTTVNNTLVVNKTGGSIAQTGILAVTTNLTITAGTLNLSGSTVQTSTVGGAISNAGTLSFTGTAAQTLTVTGAITNTGTVSIGNQTVTHALNVGGNITNNTTGAIDLRLDIDSLCTLTFTGGGVHTIGGDTSGVTEFYNVAPTTPTTDDITVNMTGTGVVSLNGSLSTRDLTVTAGTVTFNGALAAQTVTVNRNIINAGTINVSANAQVHTLNVTGDVTGNGTINLRTAAGQVANMTLTGGGTHNITGTGNLTFNDVTANNNLVVNKTAGVISQTGILAVTTNLTITAGTLNLSGAAVQTSTVGGAISNAGTLSFTGTAVQTLTVTGAITNTGTVSVGTANVTHALNVGGNITNNTTGTIDLRFDTNSLCTLTFTGGGTHTLAGDSSGVTEFYNVTMDDPTTDHITVNMSGSGGLFLNGTLAVDNLTVTDGTVTLKGEFAAQTYTINGNLLNSGSIVVSNDTRTHAMNVGGNITNNGTGDIDLRLDTNSLCTLTFTGGGTHTIGGNTTNAIGTEFYNVTMTTPTTDSITVNMTGTGGLFLNGTLATDDLTVTAGTVTFKGEFAAQTYTVNGNLVNTGSIVVSNNTFTHALNVAGNITNNTAGAIDLRFDTNSQSTLTFTGGGTHTIGGSTSGTTEFYNVTMTTPTTDSITVNMTGTGVVFLNGTLATDDLTITDGTVTLKGEFAAQTYTINGNIDIASAGTINVSDNAVLHILNLSGDLTNSGTFDMALDADSLGRVNFLGTNPIVSGGGTTDFNVIGVNLAGATTANIVNVTAVITMAGNNSGFAFTDGTFQLSSASSITPAAAITIPTNAQLTIDDPGADLTTGATLTINGGILNINDADVVTVGNAANENIALNSLATSTFLMSAGTLNVAGRIASSAATGGLGVFNLAGGTITVGLFVNTLNAQNGAPIALGSGTSFTQSNGTIIIQSSSSQAGVRDYDVQSTTSTVTGGTLQFGNASTGVATTFQINSAAPVYNLTLNTTNSPTTTLFAGLTVNNDVTIQTGATLNTSTFNITMGTSTVAGGDWINNGTFTPLAATVTFSGTGAQSIGGTTNPGTFNTLVVDKTGSSTATLAQNISIATALTVSQGTLDIATFTANGTAANRTLTVSNGAFLKIGGTNTMPTTNYTTPHALGATSTVEYYGAAQTVFGEGLSPNGYGHLILSGSATKTLSASTVVRGDLSVNATNVTFDLSTFSIDRSAAGGTITVVNGSTLKIGGTGTFPANYSTVALGASSTVEYAGAAQNVAGIDYGHLTMTGTATKTLVLANATVAGNLSVNTSGVTFDLTTFTCDGGGSSTVTVVNGAFLKIGGTNSFPAGYSTRTLGASSTVDYSGALQTVSDLSGQNYGNLTVSGTSTKTLGGNTNVAGNLTVNTTGVTLDLSTFTADRTASGGTITVVSGATLKIGGTNGFPANYTGTTLAGSTVEYYGSTQNVKGVTYGNLTLSGSGTKTLVTANATINGNLSVNTSGVTFDLDTFTANGTGTLLVVTGATLKIGGTNGFPTGYATVTLQASSTVDYAGTTQTVANQTYGNLTLSGTGVKTLFAAPTTIGNIFTITGGATATALASLTVNGNFILSTTTANAFDAGSFTHQFGGDFNDTSSPAGFAAATSTIHFNGSAAQSISGSTNTSFNNLQITNAAGVSLSGGVTKTVGGTLTLSTGNFAVGANTLVLNGGAIAGTPTNLTTTSSSNLTFGGTATVTVPSSVTVLNNLTIGKTAGTVTLAANVALSGNLSINTSGGTLDLASFTADRASAGGTLNVVNGATLKIGGTSTTFPINYSTVTLGASSTVEYYGTTQTIANYTYGNLVLNGTGNNSSGGNTTINGNLTVNSGTYDLGTFTANGGGTGTITIANGATLKIGGTGGFPTGYATVSLGATSTIEYYGSTQTVGGQSYGHLILSGTSTKTLGATASVRGNLTANTSGVTFDLSTFTCNGSGGVATITIGNGAILKINGTNTFPSGYLTTTLGASSTVQYAGTAQSVSALGYGNLTISGSGTKTLAGNASVSTTLTINNGLISTGANQLSIGAAGSVSRCASLTECFVVGNLVRGVATGSPTLTWDIGVSAPTAAYTPVTLALTTVTVTGTVLVTTTNGDHPNIGTSLLDASKSVNRYWTVANTGVTYVSVDTTFGFAAGDLDGGASTTNLAVGKYSLSDWSYPDVGTAGSTSTQAITILFADGFGDFAVAEVNTTVNPLSLWHMDQQNWLGTASEVVDSGSGGYNGTAAGLSATKPTTSMTTPAIAGNPGTCQYGVFNRANKDYVAVPSGFPNLGVGTSFTVTAWIRTTDNTQSGQRIFVDDENGTQGYAFSLGDPGTGRLRFFSRGTSTVSLDDANVLVNNRWYFVVMIADVTLKRKRIYVYDSVAAAWLSSSTNTWTGSFGSGDTGAASMGGETNSAVGEATSAFGFAGNIDEVRVYQAALGKSHLERIVALTQPCISLNHFAISHDGSAVNCQAESITIGAHITDHSLLTSYVNTVNLTTSTGHGDWVSVGGHSGSLNNGTANDGAATYTFALGDNGDAVLGLKDTFAETVSIGVADGGVTESSGTATPAEHQSLAFSATGFSFLADSVASAIGTQISGKASNVAPGSQTLEIQAIKTSDTTGACEAALNSATTIQMKLACVDPASCSSPISITGMSTVSVPTSYTGVSLNFVAGVAPYSLNYPDAGQIRLDAQYAIPDSGGSPTSNLMQGSSNPFVVKPAGLCVESTVDSACVAGDATCAKFKAAGEVFNVTVKGVDWQGAGETNTDYCTGNNVTPNFKLNSISLTPTLVAPAGGTNATLAVTSVNVTTGGTVTSATETVSEVGVFKITATPPTYLGTTIAASVSANIGRFVPDHFNVTANTPAFAHACSAGGDPLTHFTYMDQPFRYATAPVLTVTALNDSGGTTKNYGSTFWKLKAPPLTSPLLSNRTYIEQTGHGAQWDTPVPGTDNATLGGDLDLDGVGTLTLTAGDVSGADMFKYIRTAVPEAPFNADVDMLIPADDLRDIDLVCYDSANDGTCDTFTIEGITGTGTATKQQRYGRLVFGTAAGSELMALDVPMQVEYFDGTSSAFVVNDDDVCTSIDPATDLTLSSNVEAGQIDGTVDVSNSGTCADGTTTATIAHSPALDGVFGLTLSAPGSTCTGDVDIGIDLSTATGVGMDWLQYNWVGTGDPDEDPIGAAAFGVYSGKEELIYRREPWN